MLIHNLPSPDNVEAGVDDELKSYLIRSAQLLEKAGMELLAIPCNSAHIHIDAVIHSVNIPVMNIVEETALVASEKKLNSVLLLSTESTRNSGLYTAQLKRHSISTITLNDCDQKKITQNIMDVCDNKVTADTRKSTQDIIKGYPEAQGVILGCTEIPLILSQSDSDIESFDTAEILAQATFERCVLNN